MIILDRLNSLVFLLLVVFCSPVYAELYQCKDVSGRIIFKDSACDLNEQLSKSYTLEKLSERENVSSQHIINPAKLNSNLLINADFEEGLVYWKVPIQADWIKNKGVR